MTKRLILWTIAGAMVFVAGSFAFYFSLPKSLATRVESCLNSFQKQEIFYSSSIEATFTLNELNTGRDQLAKEDLSCILQRLDFSELESNEIYFSSKTTKDNKYFSVDLEGQPDCSGSQIQEIKDGKIPYIGCYLKSDSGILSDSEYRGSKYLVFSESKLGRTLTVTIKDFR